MAKPYRARHEQQPNLDRRNGLQYQQSTPREPSMRVGNAEREPLARVDQRQPVVLTGQWREHGQRYHVFINQAGPHLELMLTVVENGHVAEPKANESARGGVWSLPDGRRLNQRCLRMAGRIDPSDERHYHLSLRVGGDPIDKLDRPCGWLRRSASGTAIEIGLELAELRALNSELATRLQPMVKAKSKRLDTRPNVFENYLNQPWIPESMRTLRWFPLTPKQIEALPKFIFDARIPAHRETYEAGRWDDGETFDYRSLVEAYFNLEDRDDLNAGQVKQRRKNISATLNDLVGRARSSALTTPADKGGIDSFQLDLFFAQVTLSALDVPTLEIVDGFPHSLLTHTHHILNESGTTRDTDHFSDDLGLQWMIEGGRTYTAKINYSSLVDMVVEGQSERAFKKVQQYAKQHGDKVFKRIKRWLPLELISIVGEVHVENHDDVPFSAQYMIFASGLGKSASAGDSTVSFQSEGKAEHVYGPAWKPENLAGPVLYVDGSAFATTGKQKIGKKNPEGEGKGYGYTALTCKGSEKGKPKVPLVFDFSGQGKVFSDTAAGGIGGSVLTGKLFLADAEGGDFVRQLPGPQDQPEYRSQPTGTLHFPINGALFVPGGEVLLEIFAANELAVLSKPGMKITLKGYADQPHDALRNQILSRSRSVTVYNYLKNILGDDLAGPDQLKEIHDEKYEIDRLINSTPAPMDYLNWKTLPRETSKSWPTAKSSQNRRTTISIRAASTCSSTTKSDCSLVASQKTTSVRGRGLEGPQAWSTGR
ncbi:hypothetical protein G6O69_07495 [Pseudenhygromyxa sp. WMMC2535]|uniref:hypothetical protein n=1 Tax=Pseudenhygromyxa sp. WMMC2535 TaxID=2712867 RepID=UPI001595302C|nr:hypothetical protein [Pseudenhygromyxa sp. WMMC2535]NVB37672.1 hypothetical protein [Pseudenhygromyxa sp. WMMC2535]